MNRLFSIDDYCLHPNDWHSVFLELASLQIWDEAEALKAKEQLKQTVIKTYYRLPYDRVRGGVYRESADDKLMIEKSTHFNLMLIQLADALSQIFYLGEWRDLGQQLAAFIVSNLMNCEYKTLSNGMQCQSVNKAEQELAASESQLNKEEQALLRSLTADSQRANKRSNIAFPLTYSCSLGEAAEAINMPLKQAQIVEHSMLTKLRQSLDDEDYWQQMPSSQSDSELQLQAIGILSDHASLTENRTLLAQCYHLLTELLKRNAHQPNWLTRTDNNVLAVIKFFQAQLRNNCESYSSVCQQLRDCQPFDKVKSSARQSAYINLLQAYLGSEYDDTGNSLETKSTTSSTIRLTGSVESDFKCWQSKYASYQPDLFILPAKNG